MWCDTGNGKCLQKHDGIAEGGGMSKGQGKALEGCHEMNLNGIVEHESEWADVGGEQGGKHPHGERGLLPSLLSTEGVTAGWALTQCHRLQWHP